MANSNNSDSDSVADMDHQNGSVVVAPSSCQSRKPRKKRTKLMGIMNMEEEEDVKLKPKYGKKQDPGAPKITRPCTECGKKFWSWKALFGHMRCHPERQWRGINPPPNFRRQEAGLGLGLGMGIGLNLMTEEDHEVAACLLLLASGDKDRDRDRDIINPMNSPAPELVVGGERFECSSCKKVFGSHQALGGHRASHKNVKGCFAIAKSDDGDQQDSASMMMDINDQVDEDEEMNMNMNMVQLGSSSAGHKCSICLRVFSSGQALGGHKRCHWDHKSSDPSSSSSIINCKQQQQQGSCAPPPLDLNLPPAAAVAPLDDHDHDHDCSSSISTSAIASYSSSPLTLDLRLGL